MKDDQIEKIFAQLDRISRKLDYIRRSLEVFDGQDENGHSEGQRHDMEANSGL